MPYCEAELLIVPGKEREWLKCESCGNEFRGFEIVEEYGVRYVKIGMFGHRRLKASFVVTVDENGTGPVKHVPNP